MLVRAQIEGLVLISLSEPLNESWKKERFIVMLSWSVDQIGRLFNVLVTNFCTKLAQISGIFWAILKTLLLSKNGSFPTVPQPLPKLAS